jgi:uncharacterized small protein (DUF1192 family)
MTAVSEIRERIARLQVVACRLAHERACWEDGGIVRQQVGGEDILVRPLCGTNVRRRRLACAHTSARYAAERALLDLRKAGALGEDACAAFLRELHALGHQIHLLDHRKGDAEKALALAAETARLAEDAAADAVRDAAQSLVRTMESEHDGYAERLRDWRDRVLAAAE